MPDKSVAQLLLCYDLMQNGYPPLVFIQEDLDEWQQAVEEYESDRNAKRMVRLVRRKMEEKMEAVLAANRDQTKTQGGPKKKDCPDAAEAAARPLNRRKVCAPDAYAAVKPEEIRIHRYGCFCLLVLFLNES